MPMITDLLPEKTLHYDIFFLFLIYLYRLSGILVSLRNGWKVKLGYKNRVTVSRDLQLEPALATIAVNALALLAQNSDTKCPYMSSDS